MSDEGAESSRQLLFWELEGHGFWFHLVVLVEAQHGVPERATRTGELWSGRANSCLPKTYRDTRTNEDTNQRGSLKHDPSTQTQTPTANTQR